MNPITNIKSRQRQREDEVKLGLSETASYHHDFRHSAYIYAGQLSFKLTEGDLLAIFSEHGEVVDVNLVRCVCRNPSHAPAETREGGDKFRRTQRTRAQHAHLCPECMPTCPADLAKGRKLGKGGWGEIWATCKLTTH